MWRSRTHWTTEDWLAEDKAADHLETLLEDIAAGGEIRHRRDRAADAATRATRDSQRLAEASARAAQAAWRFQIYAEGQSEAIADCYDVANPDRPLAARAASAGRWAVAGDEDSLAPVFADAAREAAREAATGPGWLARGRTRTTASVAPAQTPRAPRTRSRTPRSQAWAGLREAARRRLRLAPPLGQDGQRLRSSSLDTQHGGPPPPTPLLLTASVDGPSGSSV